MLLDAMETVEIAANAKTTSVNILACSAGAMANSVCTHSQASTDLISPCKLIYANAPLNIDKKL